METPRKGLVHFPMLCNFSNMAAQESTCEFSGASITDESPSSFENSCPGGQTFDNSGNEQMELHDEFIASEQYTLFPCAHPTCIGDKKWYKNLEQHYITAHKGSQCSFEESIKERWRRRGDRMLQKVLSRSDMVCQIPVI